jgi:hypothetical protein
MSLRTIDSKLPDIDLLVIAKEPTLGFVLLICEVKSPLPPRWANDRADGLPAEWVAGTSPDRQRMIEGFVAGGNHPFGCLAGRKVMMASLHKPADADNPKDASAHVHLK